MVVGGRFLRNNYYKNIQHEAQSGGIHNTLSLIDTSQGPCQCLEHSPSQPPHCIHNRKEDRKKLIAEVQVLDEYGYDSEIYILSFESPQSLDPSPEHLFISALQIFVICPLKSGVLLDCKTSILLEVECEVSKHNQ